MGIPRVVFFDDQVAWLAVHTSRTAVSELMRVVWRTEWDLSPHHGRVRFGRNPAEHTALAKEYGHDITTWPGWETLRQARELQLVTSVIASLPGAS